MRRWTPSGNCRSTATTPPMPAKQGDLDLYRASRRANIACKEAIEAAISEHYRDNRLDKDAVPQVIEQFGYTRILYVLANTVQQKEWDERFSPANKAWARTVDIPPNPDGFGGERNLDFVVDSHSGLVDLFLSQARQDYLRLQPLTPRKSVPRPARLLQELRAPGTPNSPTAPTTWPAFRQTFWPAQAPRPMTS